MPDAIPRLAFEDIDRDLQAFLRPTVERLGYFGELFQALGHLPTGLQAFMEYTAAVKEPLPLNLNEVCALTVCGMTGADYERIQHERLSEKSGLSRAWIAVLVGSEAAGEEVPEASPLDETERKVRDLARAVVERKGERCGAELAAVAEALGPERAVAVLLQITRFMTIAVLVHALDVAPPAPSIFAQAREPRRAAQDAASQASDRR